mgnify:CR=1 FL=1
MDIEVRGKNRPVSSRLDAVAREILRRMGYPDPDPQPESAHTAPASREGRRR